MTGKQNKKRKQKERNNSGKQNKTKKLPPDNKDLFIGVLQGNSKGFGFLICKEREEDIFIPAGSMNGAMHGDTIAVRQTSMRKGGGEGEVVEIIKRANPKIVGTYNNCKGFGFVIPDDERIVKDVFISNKDSLSAKNNDKVVVEITAYPKDKKTEGRIVEVLGQPNDRGVDMLSIIRAYNLYQTFPKSVESEADKTADTVSQEEKAGREDFTSDLVITIDGDDARDFDDAVSVVQLDGGLTRLYVHIADVTHYVKAQSKLDKEAYKRGTSVYFPDMVLPMLPQKLSNGICSLNENVERLTLSCIMDIDKSGKVVRHSIKEGVICSKNRMTYSNVTKILDGDKQLCSRYAHIVPMLKQMQSLAKTLYKKRENRGAIEFEITESQIILDDNLKVVDIQKKPREVSHRIIEEFMLAANETIAEHMFSESAPFIYRAHETPPTEKIETLIDFLKCLGVDFNISAQNPQPSDFQKMLANVGERLAPIVNRVSLRAMTKASYEPQNKGHFGLAAKFYCHFTSPIRRYPDLVIHRIIKDFLHSGKSCFAKYVNFTAEASAESSERERLAEKAERDVDDLKKAEFMSDKIGNSYSGIVSGVTEWGIFVELDNSVEGLIRVEKLPGDNYIYNQRLMTLSNEGSRYRIGDNIDITVEAVNYNKIEFRLKG